MHDAARVPLPHLQSRGGDSNGRVRVGVGQDRDDLFGKGVAALDGREIVGGGHGLCGGARDDDGDKGVRVSNWRNV